ncbi:Threonine/homoserine/homoserine lactone efflux protein [Roseomonas rosea]|uniref:Threonine/homoserine/homoserine lactone efflux protein n=1 Tax=Muricoccus roseus TaxID=198092 RepID=A0A1M6BCN5_9PROT|nr:LysE family translocator [Roseomonas rosea]SHI46447.1 Threonine/homoserine/homoserine lactone efflux protein [Roseomonas rosea]
MPSLASLLAFAALSVGLALTPGPNLFYLVSRTLTQGTRAGMLSLIGCQAGSLVIMLGAAAGVTAALLAVPYAYDAMRLGGAGYLAWLAWQSVRPGGAALFSPRPIPPEGGLRLFTLGFATAALNPKVALFYVAVLPAFMDPALGSLFTQGLVLGAVQIGICTLFDALLVAGAGGVARFLSTRPAWLAVQRWVLGGALALLAAKLATESRA